MNGPANHGDTDAATGETEWPWSSNELPFEDQRQAHELLSQETRYYILQVILGHPHHLVSLDEFEYFVPKSRPSIRDQLEKLKTEGVIRDFLHESNESRRAYPTTFWGLTADGAELLHQFSYLRGVPVLRALYDATRLDEHRKRHLNAPRPDLPSAVTEALTFDENEARDLPDPSDALAQLARGGRTPAERESSPYSESTTAETQAVNESETTEERDEESPLDELF